MLKFRLFHVRQPMRRPFGHAAHVRNNSDSVVIRVSLTDVPEVSGLGECAPRAYVTGEDCDSVLARAGQPNLTKYHALFQERDAPSAFERFANISLQLGEAARPNLRCLLEMSLFDLLCHVHGRSCLDGLRECARAMKLDETLLHNPSIDRLPFSIVVDSTGGINPDDAVAPPAVIKVKAGPDVHENVARVGAVRRQYGYDSRLLIDANMSWSADSALEHIKALSAFDVYMYEEPLAPRQYSSLRGLRRRTGAKVMLDESLITFEDAVQAREQEACDAFNIRVSKCGGLLAAMRLMVFAISQGVPYQLGVQVAEVGPLITASRALAFLYGSHFALEAGQSDRFFETSIVTPRPLVDRRANVVPRPSGVGLGMALSPSAAAYAVDQMLAS